MKHIVKKINSEWRAIPDTAIEILVNAADYSVSSNGDESLGQRLFCNAIADWRGLENEDGTPFDCTGENKITLFRYSDLITAFVIEESKKLRDDFDRVLKNS